MTALLAELGVGRLWEGKEALLAALAAAVGADVRMVAGQEAVVVAALMAAAGRKKVRQAGAYAHLYLSVCSAACIALMLFSCNSRSAPELIW